MDNKNKLLRNIKFAIWGITILVITFLFVKEVAFNPTDSSLNSLKYLIVLPPVLMAIWMMIAFSIHLISNAGKTRSLNNVIFEMKKSSAFNLVGLLVVSMLIVAGYYYIIQNNTLQEKFQIKNMDTIAFTIFALMFLVCHLLLVVTIYRFWAKPSFFIVTDKGFLYEPGGISPGLIFWEDIASMDERELLYNPGPHMNSLRTKATYLVIALKDPSKYYKNYNPMLRIFIILFAKIIEMQTNEPGDIILKPADFGNNDKYEAAKSLMKINMMKYGTRATNVQQ